MATNSPTLCVKSRGSYVVISKNLCGPTHTQKNIYCRLKMMWPKGIGSFDGKHLICLYVQSKYKYYKTFESMLLICFKFLATID